MKVGNVRIGFATNSSSTHSIVRMSSNDLKSCKDNYFDNQFGWDNFTLVSPQAKIAYLAQTLYSALYGTLPDTMILPAIEAMFPKNGMRGAGRPKVDGYVDHQSLLRFPTKANGKLHEKFLKEFVEFVVRDNVVILGGNDNSEGHPLRELGEDTPTYFLRDSEQSIARKDGDWWLFFNPHTGSRIRLTLVEDPEEYAPATPLMVDLKITDYCSKGCSFCYQNSSKQGKHGEMSFLSSLAYALGDAEVFEVAIGGGEPTEHPRIVDILRTFRWHNVIPNFSTGSLRWMRDQELARKILEFCGGFAYSVTHPQEVKQFAFAVEALRKYGDFTAVPSLHVVMGIMSKKAFENILRAASLFSFPVTLLDYKLTGRAEEPQYPEYPEWVAEVLDGSLDFGWAQVGVDTPLMAKLEKMGVAVSTTLYHTVEGRESMYLDAVERKAYKASYLDQGGVAIPEDSGKGCLKSGSIKKLFQEVNRS